MAKYNMDLVERARQWVSKYGLGHDGGASMAAFINAFHITPMTFSRWLQQHKEFAEAIDEGRAVFRESLKVDLVHSLAIAAKGEEREQTEETTEYKPNPHDPSRPMISKKTVKKSKLYVKPNVSAAIFLLTNIDPEHFKYRQTQDITTNNRIKISSGERFNIEDIPDDVLFSVADALQTSEVAKLTEPSETDETAPDE